MQKEMDFINISAPGGLNGFQRRLVHQMIRTEFPAYRTFSRNNGEFMQVEKLDHEREASVNSSQNFLLLVADGFRSQSLGCSHSSQA
jgi:poly(A)-specific ribonuclease